MEEQWKDVVGYEKIYEVSNLGQVRNYHTGQILKGVYDKDGYLRLSLHKNKKGKNVLIHRLVATAFIPNEDEEKNMIDHINRIKTDNNVSNLRWVTNGQNQLNTKLNERNTSGHKGVDWSKRSNKWRVSLKVGKRIHGGFFDNLEDAIRRREELEKEFIKF